MWWAENNGARAREGAAEGVQHKGKGDNKSGERGDKERQMHGTGCSRQRGFDEGGMPKGAYKYKRGRGGGEGVQKQYGGFEYIDAGGGRCGGCQAREADMAAPIGERSARNGQQLWTGACSIRHARIVTPSFFLRRRRREGILAEARSRPPPVRPD